MASGSPRRFTLLKELGLKFKVDPAIDFEEIKGESNLEPSAIAMHNAEGKALEIAKKHPNSYI